MMVPARYWKRFISVFLLLLAAAALISAGHVLLLEWLPSQVWYSGESDHLFVLDEIAWEIMAGTFQGMMFGAVFVCAVDAALAARLNVRKRSNRLAAAAAGTVIFFPLGLLGFAPAVGGVAKSWAVVVGFHLSVILLFYCALTLLSWCDRRCLKLWDAPDVDLRETI